MIFMEKKNIFYMFLYKPLAVRALILEIIFITDYQAHGLLLQMLCINCFHIFPNIYNTILHKETQIEKIVSLFNNTI